METKETLFLYTLICIVYAALQAEYPECAAKESYEVLDMRQASLAGRGRS
jgi:hypothetical protein